REVRHIRVAISHLPPERQPLGGHVIERRSGIIHVGFIAEISRKVGRPGNRVRPVDRWEEGQITSWVGHLAAAKSYAVMVMSKLETLVGHPSKEHGLDAAVFVVKTVLATAVLATGIGRE